MRQAADFSWGYDDSSKERMIVANRDATAGAINSNAKDMGQWLRLLLGGGSIDGKRIVSEAGFQEMLTKLTRVYEESYGLGLWVFDPQNTLGTQLYGHPGGVDGFSAQLMFAPARKLGFAILTNSSDSGGRYTMRLPPLYSGACFSNPKNKRSRSFRERRVGNDENSWDKMTSLSLPTSLRIARIISSSRSDGLILGRRFNVGSAWESLSSRGATVEIIMSHSYIQQYLFRPFNRRSATG